MVHRTISRKCNERRPSCKTRNLLLMAAVSALAACAPKASAPAREPVVVGGWQPANPNEDGIQAAARYAAAHVPPGHGELAEVASAETQVVAGTNIRMVLRLADRSRWKAVVWHRLDGTFALTEARQLP